MLYIKESNFETIESNPNQINTIKSENTASDNAG